MRLILLTGFLILCAHARTQILTGITETEVSRIEKTLASDDMRGRKVYTPGIEKAATFIMNEFRESGLVPLKGAKGYAQDFALVEPGMVEMTATLDGKPVDSRNIMVLSAEPVISISTKDNYQKVYVRKDDNLSEVFFKYLDEDKNVVVLVDTSFAAKFHRLAQIQLSQFSGSGNRIFILTASSPTEYDIRIRQTPKNKKLKNIVGVIPGKSKPDEYVIFSAHYDHLGVGQPDASGDTIYNGANDNASGTTAILTLARYFGKTKSNERSIVFVAFTAEEIGEFGSAYFSRQFNPEKVVAMLNIEMIGTESKWGGNSAYITGFDKSSLGPLLQKNLAGTTFTFYPDPYTEEMLFLRSDNASLAKRGVPAHTISTSKMDSEKYYHTRGDEVGTLDLANMTRVISAIGISAGPIISGAETPTRVKTD